MKRFLALLLCFLIMGIPAAAQDITISKEALTQIITEEVNKAVQKAVDEAVAEVVKQYEKKLADKDQQIIDLTYQRDVALADVQKYSELLALERKENAKTVITVGGMSILFGAGLASLIWGLCTAGK